MQWSLTHLRSICWLIAAGVALCAGAGETLAAPDASQLKAKGGQVVARNVSRVVPLSQAFAIDLGGGNKVQCGPSVCTCSGVNDCDALFTSTLCKSGTEQVDPDDNGQCEKN